MDGSSLSCSRIAFKHKADTSENEGDKTHRFSAPEADLAGTLILNPFILDLASTKLLTTVLCITVICRFLYLLRRLQSMTLSLAFHQQLSFLISILISVPNTSVMIPQLTVQPFTCISVATISHRLSIVIIEEISVKNTTRRNISTKMAYRYAQQVIL